MAKTIVLGEGIFAIDGVDIGLCRGGGQFVVERENRIVNADGDKGPVKGRIRKTGSVPKLTMNSLEIIKENLPKLFPATEIETDNGETTFKPKPDIEESDYLDEVTWTGRTIDGEAVIITLKNAINLENLDWTFADKDEIVQPITLTGTYDENKRDEEPWKVKFVSEEV